MCFAAFSMSRIGAFDSCEVSLHFQLICLSEILSSTWLDDAGKNVDVSTKTFVFVGNKSDMLSKRVVGYDESLALAQKLSQSAI